MSKTIVVSYGAGTNSTAMLVGMMERGERPDIILFADTGGEKPETYLHLKAVSAWCEQIGFPEIEIVKKGGRQETLEENCLRMKMLPSIAYGHKSCSSKYKIEPQDKYCNNSDICISAWGRGEKIIKLIGYDAEESRRAKISEDGKYSYVYPLIEWGWGRHQCTQAIARAGLPQPGKSACFFCPSNKQHEVLALFREHRDLFDRALAIEDGAELTTVKGLGRGWSWRELIYGDPRQMSFDADWLKFVEVEQPCGCYDG